MLADYRRLLEYPKVAQTNVNDRRGARTCQRDLGAYGFAQIRQLAAGR